jgi:TM2 domain-containing membrane protein YozV
MQRSIKAALLSGLIFPGLGHMSLKQYRRGTALILTTLAALAIIVNISFQRAQIVVDRINSGDIPVDAVAISDAVAHSADGANGFIQNAAVIVLGICWLVGIIDSYRLGAAQEKPISK